jgi:thermitase
MFSFLYPVSFLLSLAVLTGWFYKRDNEKTSHLLRNMFFVTAFLFGISWLLSQGSMSYKLMVLGRELIILALLPVLLSVFRRTTWLFTIALLISLLVLKLFYFPTLMNTFPQKTESDVGNLQSSGELLIEIKEGHSIDEIKKYAADFGFSTYRAFTPKDIEFTDLDDYYVVDIPENQIFKLDKIRKELEGTAAIEWLENNEEINVAPVEAQRPTPIINRKFGLNDPGVDNLWGFESMKIDELYNILKNVQPKRKALIAILDTGVDAGHEDLRQNFKSTQAKYDTDKAGHGTHCAGIAGAVSNNNIGIASFSQDNSYVQITSIKVLSDGGFGSQKTIIDGILEAADINADVISLSLGGPSSDSRQRAYQKAVEYANRKGAIVIVAAGNSNRNAKGFSPANAPGVISVSAVDTLLGRASFSNFVQEIEMAVAAPGVKIFSTFPGSQYQTFNGTSMATPYVSGLSGLMKSINPALTTKDIWKILNDTGAQTKNTHETGKLIQPASAIGVLVK